MRDRLIKLIEQCSCHYSPPCTGECFECHNVEMYDKEISHIADYLLANGVIVPPCKVGTTVYVITPKWYGIWGEVEHECRRCEHFYWGGMGDNPECSLGKNCCHQICEEKADLRSLAEWITPSSFTKEIAWGKTVFLTREEAEKALAEREGKG